jgi:CRISPR/Cas system-associated exonuclease Cas4 (RecB family)
MSAHVLIDDQLVSGCRNIIDEIRELLSKKFSVLHSTIQLECDRCDMSPVCSLPNDVRKES